MSQLQNISYNLGIIYPGVQNNSVVGIMNFADGSSSSTSALTPGYAQIFTDLSTNSYPATLIVTNPYTNQVIPFASTTPCATVQTNNNPAISGIVTGDTFINVNANGTLSCVPVTQYSGTRSISNKRDSTTNNGSISTATIVVIIVVILIILVILYLSGVRQKK